MALHAQAAFVSGPCKKTLADFRVLSDSLNDVSQRCFETHIGHILAPKRHL
jgi:hypothetical protein